MWQPWLLWFILGSACLPGIATPAWAADSTEEKEPIKINLPDPSFSRVVSDIVDYQSPHLEPENFRDRPPFLAPKGTALVSQGKPVSASVKTPVRGELNMLVDGDKSYKESSEIELPEGMQWVQIDLGAAHEVYAVLLWHYLQRHRVYFGVVVQVSNDPEFKTGVTTLFNSDYQNAAQAGVGKDMEYLENNKGKLIDAKGIKARHVRCYSNGNNIDKKNHYVEIEVFGKPIK